MKPIAPTEVSEAKAKALPEGVIEVFNTLIALKFNAGAAVLDLAETAAEVAAKLGLSQKEIFEKGYMDVEPIYRSAGWVVHFDQPGYNESYPATYTFVKKR